MAVAAPRRTAPRQAAPLRAAPPFPPRPQAHSPRPRAPSPARCCAECKGSWSKPWLHSGTLVSFNDAYNQNHTHGIPTHDEEADGPCGPRISVALLCSEAASPMDGLLEQGAAEMLCSLRPRKPPTEQAGKAG